MWTGVLYLEECSSWQWFHSGASRGLADFAWSWDWTVGCSWSGLKLILKIVQFNQVHCFMSIRVIHFFKTRWFRWFIITILFQWAVCRQGWAAFQECNFCWAPVPGASTDSCLAPGWSHSLVLLLLLSSVY